MMPKAKPVEFRRDVVAVARRREAPLKQIAKDFGICEATLYNWMKADEVETGARPGVTVVEAAEIRELRKRNKVLEQAVVILRRATAYFASREHNLPKD